MKILVRPVLPLAAVLALVASFGAAQERVTRSAGSDAAAPNPRAARVDARTGEDGLVHDRQQALVMQWDGTAERFYLYGSDDPSLRSEFVQLLTMTADSGTIVDLRVCFDLLDPVAEFEYQAVFYRNDGGTPGALIEAVDFVFENAEPGENCILGVVDVPVSQRRVFVGARWASQGAAGIYVDENGSATSPGFGRPFPNDPWEELPVPGTGFDSFRNLGLDLEFVPGDDPQPETCPATACVAGTETLCLENDRFEVTADFVDQAGGSGAVEFAEELTPNTGYGHYGNPDNVELVVKVLNACGPSLNNRFWVFAAGLTDQEITLRVCDTETGMQNTYFSPLKTAFQPITDTDAFATCP